MQSLPDCPILDHEIQEHRSVIEREIGAHDERLRTLEREMGEMRRDVKQVLSEIHQARGGWRALMLGSAVAGSVGALVVKALAFFK